MNEQLITKIKLVLNILFMIGAVITIILYFIPGVPQAMVFYVCACALFFKMIEVVLRTFQPKPPRRM